MLYDSNIIRIFGNLKTDDWAGKVYIAQLLNKEGSLKKYSEYWLGLHPSFPSTICHHSDDIHLIDHINNKINTNCKLTEVDFPFLLKVLDVEKMLSIQVHPNYNLAEEGFKCENSKININHMDRLYKDPNPKYEVLYAISDFYLLQGFLENEKLSYNLEKFLPLEFNEKFLAGGYKSLCLHISKLSNAETSIIVENIIAKIQEESESVQSNKSYFHYWILKYLSENLSYDTSDKGFIYVLLLNIVKLEKGEAIYTEPGIIHSYLHGICLEVMSNSDNVMRYGLTKKKINYNEAFKATKFIETKPVIIKSELIDGLQNYIFSEANFKFKIVNSFNLNKTFTSTSIEILLVLEGSIYIIDLDNNRKKTIIKQGESIMTFPNTRYTMQTDSKTLAIIATSTKSFP